LEFVNAGPGLAIQLGYFVVEGTLKAGGIVGMGHLQPGERAQVRMQFSALGSEVKKGDYPNMGESFTRMDPRVPIPPGRGF
jgi:hypothetical protein